MRMTGCPNGCARPYVAGKWISLRTFSHLFTICRGRVRWQGSWLVRHAAWGWLLWATAEQNLSRSVFTFLIHHSVIHSYIETVTEPEILAILQPMIKRYALERHDDERFGDFVIRAGYIAPTTAGKAWYENSGGEGLYRES